MSPVPRAAPIATRRGGRRGQRRLLFRFSKNTPEPLSRYTTVARDVLARLHQTAHDGQRLDPPPHVDRPHEVVAGCELSWGIALRAFP